MTRDNLLKNLVEDTINQLLNCQQHIDVKNILTTQFNRALDIGTNYLKFQHPNSHAIKQLDKFGNLIQPFESIRQASRITEIPKSSIIKVLKGKQHTAGKTLWKYDDKT